jgi:hypothetical protein
MTASREPDVFFKIIVTLALLLISAAFLVLARYMKD